MIRRTLLIATFVAPAFLFAQKALTLRDAILKAGTEYAPERLRGLQWIEGAPNYSYVKGDVLMRGTLIAAFAVCVAIAVTIAAWHMIEPTLSPRWRHALRELALGVAMIVSLPLLAVVLFVMQGTVAALLIVAGVALFLIGLWRVFAASVGSQSARIESSG